MVTDVQFLSCCTVVWRVHGDAIPLASSVEREIALKHNVSVYPIISPSLCCRVCHNYFQVFIVLSCQN